MRTRIQFFRLKILLITITVVFIANMKGASAGSAVVVFGSTAPSPQATQDQPAAANPPVDQEPVTELTVESVEAALAELEKNSGVDSSQKDLLRPKYKQAIDKLNLAAENRIKAEQYRLAISNAPGQVTELNSKLQRLPSVEAAREEARDAAAGLDSEALQVLLESRQEISKNLQSELSAKTAQLAEDKLRPVAINQRLLEAERELVEIRGSLASPELSADSLTPLRAADRLVFLATEAQLVSELEMLKQEQASLTQREDLLETEISLLTRRLENAQEQIRYLEQAKNETLTNQARQIDQKLEAIQKSLSPTDSQANNMVAEVRELVTQLIAVVDDLKSVSNAKMTITQRMDRLTEENQYVTAQLAVGGRGDVISQLLFALQSQILRRGDNSDVMGQLPELDTARVADLQTNQLLRQQKDVEGRFADAGSEAIPEILKYRRELLSKLQSQQKAMVIQLSEVQLDNKKYVSKAADVLDFVYEQLFWVRSLSPVDRGTLAEMPAASSWLFSREHMAAFFEAQVEKSRRQPIPYYGVLVLIGALIFLRGWMISQLEQTGLNIRRISTDQYQFTAWALLWTTLLALPIPMFFAFLWWALEPGIATNDWLRGIANGLKNATWLTLLVVFAIELCRPGGLGHAHFGWKEIVWRKSRTLLTWFGIVFIPALLITDSTLFGAFAAEYGGSIGRVCFIVSQLWATCLLWRCLGTRKGILAFLVEKWPASLAVRTRYFWAALLLLWPIILAGLAWQGYLITGNELSKGLLATVGICFIGAVCYWMSLRWFALKKRKLALSEALARRRARRESGTETASRDEVVTADADEELELDLDSISEQTRHLLQMLFGLSAVVAVVVYWSNTIPIFTALEQVKVPLTESLTLLELGEAALVFVITWIAVQNLYGLLELSVLRATNLDKGTRYAISRISQYVVSAIGIVTLFRILGFDWSQFGWIAAALSVGLGFGLQEVVANFVCGLIVLFERPVRIGDVVTLNDVTGTVSRIQMRATTITNWDRQELIVPNKNLVTGTILNWTLSASINRIVIPVGIAYGSDTKQAQELLTRVAVDHPLILDDPPPSTSFEEFADSSLIIILRAFLPDLDSRLTTISELHTEINHRFNAAGIEIAFPQLDLHVRNGGEAKLQESLQQAVDRRASQGR